MRKKISSLQITNKTAWQIFLASVHRPRDKETNKEKKPIWSDDELDENKYCENSQVYESKHNSTKQTGRPTDRQRTDGWWWWRLKQTARVVATGLKVTEHSVAEREKKETEWWWQPGIPECPGKRKTHWQTNPFQVNPFSLIETGNKNARKRVTAKWSTQDLDER